jgi:hypothetical protein
MSILIFYFVRRRLYLLPAVLMPGGAIHLARLVFSLRQGGIGMLCAIAMD